MVQWLGLVAFTDRDPGSIPGGRNKIPPSCEVQPKIYIYFCEAFHLVNVTTFIYPSLLLMDGFPSSASGKELACQCRRY